MLALLVLGAHWARAATLVVDLDTTDNSSRACTSRTLNRVRFTVTRITAAKSPSSTNTAQAILSLVSSTDETGVAVTGGTVAVSGTSLEANALAPAAGPAQPLGGALGSSTSFNSILSTPLLPGATRNYSFLFQIQRAGSFTAILNIEALPTP